MLGTCLPIVLSQGSGDCVGGYTNRLFVSISGRLGVTRHGENRVLEAFANIAIAGDGTRAVVETCTQ